MPRGQVNQLKAEYIRLSFELNRTPGGRGRRRAETFYTNQFYDFAEAERPQATQNLRNRVAAAAAAAADDADDQDDENDDGQAVGGNGDDENGADDAGTGADGKDDANGTAGGDDDAEAADDDAIVPAVAPHRIDRNPLADQEDEQQTNIPEGGPADGGPDGDTNQDVEDAPNAEDEAAANVDASRTGRPTRGQKRDRPASPGEGEEPALQRQKTPTWVTRHLDELPPKIREAKVDKAMKAIRTLHPPFQPDDHVVDGGRWELDWGPGEKLGTGGQGCVFAYKGTKDGTVVDRITVKDSLLSSAKWSAFHKWDGPVNQLKDRRPMEVALLERLRTCAEPGYCLQIRGWRVDNDTIFYRLYTNYCAYNDLYNLQRRAILEPALWSLLEDMTKGFLNLQHGTIDSNEDIPGWIPIVHHDIKDGNIFVDDKGDRAEYPSYPKAVIGDFGHAIPTNNDDPMNPNSYVGEGTPDWLAPEQRVWRDGRTYMPKLVERLGEKTNVWGMGAVMIRMINQGHADIVPAKEQSEPGWEGHAEAPGWAGGGWLSDDLKTLINKCVRYHPEERPTFREIQQEILERMMPDPDVDDDDDNYVRFVRSNPIDRSDADQEKQSLFHERYPRGF